MPIYEYECDNCGKQLEVIQKFSDEPLSECPGCKQSSLHKKTSMAAFHLKGGGWYKDGYTDNGKSDTSENASKTPETAETAETKSSAEAKSTADNSAESKPAKTDSSSKTSESSVPSSKAS